METWTGPQTSAGKPDPVPERLWRTACEWCGTPFPPGPRRGKPRRWCRDRCRALGRQGAPDLEVLIGLKVLRAYLDDLLRRVADRRETNGPGANLRRTGAAREE